MKRVGTPQNFFLRFTDELEKRFLLEKLLNWANKKRNNFDIYIVAVKKKEKNQDISLFYTCVPKILMIWYTVPEIRSMTKLKLRILGHLWIVTDRIFLSFCTVFCPFTPLMNQKITILKKWRKHQKKSFYTCVP